MTRSAARIELLPETGWTPVAPLSGLGPIRSFVSGDAVGDRIQIAYFQREGDQALVAKVWFGPGAEGPPGHAHGGSVAAVLDEAMGGVAWMAGLCVVAKTLRVEFRAMVPLERVVTVEAAVVATDGRRVHAAATMCDVGLATLAEASGLFVKVRPERLRLAPAP
jgi:acyl-coenzyme A thioesterase PaaI-like protein